jgi:hypothetical protein
MSFDISRLTSAVNRYLNSISEISSAAKRSQEEIASRTLFSAELSSAIRQNIESRMRDQVNMPDIGSQVQDTVETQIKQAVSSIDNTFEQISGAFEEIRSAGKVDAAAMADKAKDVVDASTAADAVTSKDNSTSAVKTTTGAAVNTNRDAYSGILSAEALQELSKSQYFSANLIQGSLFNENSDEEKSGSSVTSAFDTASLSDLNNNSLLANSLIKAYTGSTASSTTSIFGDFTL